MCYHLAAYACGIWGGDIPACQANQKTVNLPWSTLYHLALVCPADQHEAADVCCIHQCIILTCSCCSCDHGMTQPFDSPGQRQTRHLQRLCLHQTRNVILHWSTCMVHEWPVPAAISEATCSISQHTRFTIRGWPQQFRFSGNIYVHYGDTTNFMLLVTFWPLFPMQSPGLLVGIA